jgi:hypothetical protein
MKWILYAISLIWITFGACAILYTSETRNASQSMFKGIDHRIIAILPAVAGLLLLFAASASRNAWLLRLFGILGIIKGVFIFTNPNKLHDRVLDWYLESVSDQGWRLHGIVAIILGTAVLSWIL